MITKNEEKYLENCINSVKNIIDEIIIVDTGSKDRTKEIAKKFNAKIYDFEWNHSFSEARNFSLQKATKEWILVLDADETISNKDLDNIKNLTINKNNDKNKKIIGHSFIQRNYNTKIKRLKWNYRNHRNPSRISRMPKMQSIFVHNDFYDESKPFLGWTYRGITRLFRNDKRIKFIYPVHETVIESIKNINGKIKQTNMPIHHFELMRGKEFINKKLIYYIKLLKNKIKLFPKAKFYFELALELEKLNDMGAKIHFDKAVELDSNYKKLIIDP